MGVLLQELRNAGRADLDADTLAKRKETLFKNRKQVVPSGGLAGFRVASDLCKMDFNSTD